VAASPRPSLVNHLPKGNENMELTQIEVAALEKVVEAVQSVQELNDLQLTLVGGGIATTVVG